MATKMWSPVGRVSFPKVFEAEGYQGSEPKFSVMLVFEPAKFTPTEKKLWAAMIKAADEASMDKFKKPLKSLPASFRKPFRDGAEKEDLEGFGEGKVFINFSSKMRPGIVDKDLNSLESKEEFYAGCYARVTCTTYTYDNTGKGVSFGLQNIQKIAEGTRLDGRSNADADFADAPEFEAPAEPESEIPDDDIPF